MSGDMGKNENTIHIGIGIDQRRKGKKGELHKKTIEERAMQCHLKCHILK